MAPNCVPSVVLVLTTFVAWTAELSLAEPNTCRYPDDSMLPEDQVKQGITWDLSGLTLSDGHWYGAHDKDNNDTKNYEFFFNICGTLKESRIDRCGNSQVQSQPSSSPAAFVYDMDRNQCFKLGDYPRGEKGKFLSYHVDPHDTNRPAAGVNLWYKLGGDSNFCNGKTPHLKVAVLCGSRHTPMHLTTHKLNNNSFVDKVGECTFEVHAIDPAGCPKECPIRNGEVCSSNGHCAYDLNSQQARCFCEEGYKGDDCSIKPGRSSAAAVGATFGGIFVGLLGVAGFWYYKHRWTGKTGYQPGQDDDEGFY